MPKRASDVWEQYQVIGVSGNKKHVVCIHCNTEYRNSHTTRMVLHLTKCQKCPADIKKKYMNKSLQKPNESTSVRVTTSRNSNEQFYPRSSTSSSSPLVLRDENSIDQSQHFPDAPNTVPVEENSNLSENYENIDVHIARAIYASGAPLSLLESNYWKKALKSLNPNYSPPSRHSISNNLLDAEFSRVKSDVDEKIRSSAAVSIITDGWTNINGKGVINFIISTPEPIFYKSIYPEWERETGEYLSSEIIKVIEEIGPAKITAVITDNAKNMKAAWRLVQNKYPQISCIGCVAHSLNLIYKDIHKLPSLRNTTDTVTKIIKFIKNKHRALAYFEKIQTTLYGNLRQTLKLPCKTRWNSVVISLDSFDSNKEALKALVVADDISVENDIITALLDDSLWLTVKSIINVLKPISEAITQSESDSARISDVPITFLKLSASVEDELHSSVLQDDEKETIRKAIIKRRKFCLRPIHLAANLLDPKYMGSALKDEEQADANNCIHDQAIHLGKDPVAVMTNVVEFRTKTGYFSKCYSAWITTETVAPHLWWQSFAPKQELFRIACRLLSIPASSAAAERNWSLFANTHTKLRNRLLQERVNKLIAVRQNLRYFEHTAEKTDDNHSNCDNPNSVADFGLIRIDASSEDDDQATYRDSETEIESNEEDWF